MFDAKLAHSEGSSSSATAASSSSSSSSSSLVAPHHHHHLHHPHHPPPLTPSTHQSTTTTSTIPPHHFSPLCPCIYCQGATTAAAVSTAGSAAATAELMDPTSQHYSPYHHPYYRVGSTVKDHPHQSVESVAQAAAVQSRILEMRKEKSRDAARSRRGKENHEFYELAKLLPLPAAITSQLDKASIIRLTISYLKLRDFTLNGDPTWNLSPTTATLQSSLKSGKLCKQSSVFDVHQGTHILQSLDGFAFALGSDGRFLYISETVSIYLGLSQVEMTGSSLFDYVHQQDHAELAEILGLNLSSHHHHSIGGHPGSSASPLPPPSVGSNASSNESDSHYSSSTGNFMTFNGPNDTFERQFCIRMKSTLTKRGCQHFKSSGYRVVHVIAHLRLENNQSQLNNNGRRDSPASTSTHHHHHNHPPKIIGLVGLAIALPPPSVNELRLESDMFIIRLGLDFKIVHIEPRVTEVLGFAPEDLIGRSMYSLVYAPDVIHVRKVHQDLMHKGQVMSKYYRVLNKSGGFYWIQSCVTLINNNTTPPIGGGPNGTNGGSSSGNSSKSPTNGNANNNSSSSSTPTPNNNNSNNNNSSTSNEEQDQCIICIIAGPEYDDVIMDSGQLDGFDVPTTPIIIKQSSTTRSSPTKVHTHPVIRSHPPSPSSPPPPTRGHHLNHRGGIHHEKSSTPSSPSSPSSLTIVSSDAKRRRFTSSPVRPWKSPSPSITPTPTSDHHHSHHLHHQLHHHHPSATATHSNESPSSTNLLRHISVIRETPPILKPQVMTPPYHPHHPVSHHHHHPHYHPLVDPYTAAYHLYKNGSAATSAAASAMGASAASSAPGVPTGHPHPWGAYN